MAHWPLNGERLRDLEKLLAKSLGLEAEIDAVAAKIDEADPDHLNVVGLHDQRMRDPLAVAEGDGGGRPKSATN